jgi:hypothetical protein
VFGFVHDVIFSVDSIANKTAVIGGVTAGGPCRLSLVWDASHSVIPLVRCASYRVRYPLDIQEGRCGISTDTLAE